MHYIVGLTDGDTAPVDPVTSLTGNPHREFAEFFMRHRHIDGAILVDARGNALYEGEQGEVPLSCEAHPIICSGVRLDFNPRTGKAPIRPVGCVDEVFDGPDRLGCYAALPVDAAGRQYGAFVRKTK